MTVNPAANLEVEQSATVRVIARRRWNGSGISVSTRQIFNFRVLAHRRWIDFFVPTTPNGYPSFLYLSRFERRLRLPDQNWYRLIGAVGREDDFAFSIGMGPREVEMTHDGDLFFFANDVPEYYWNNFGVLELEITRLK